MGVSISYLYMAVTAASSKTFQCLYFLFKENNIKVDEDGVRIYSAGHRSLRLESGASSQVFSLCLWNASIERDLSIFADISRVCMQLHAVWFSAWLCDFDPIAI